MGVCGSVYRPSQRERQSGIEECMTEATNDFAFSLYNELAALERNFICSPYCVNILLSMLLSGASGDTARELSNTLDYNGITVHQMQEVFEGKIEELKKTLVGIYMEIANSIWIQEGLSTKKSFKDIVALKYRVHQLEVDFRNRSPEVTTRINDWGRVCSRGVIERLLSQDVDPESSMILLNAVSFTGLWEKAFLPETTEANFYNNGSESDTSLVRFMHQKSKFWYLRNDTPPSQILCMDYFNKCMSIVLFLPENAAQLHETEKTLSHEKYLDVLFKCSQTMVHVTLPFFKLSSNFNLVQSIKNLGIHSIFETNAALSGIAEGAMVNSIIHSVVLRVTEEGNLPAAKTPEPREDDVQTPPVEHFKADRPFGFLIVNNRTRIIVFMGRVVTIPPV